VPAPAPTPEGRSWWRDPVGDTLLGVGLVGIGVGTAYLVVGNNAQSDMQHATTYAAYQTYSNRANSDGKIGVGMVTAGGGLAVVSLIWYVTHRGHESPPVTGWLGTRSGGLAFATGF
jgi:hypothetical protein